MEEEIWKEIDGYDGFYLISNFGKVKSLKNKKEIILKQQTHRDGYFYIGLRKNKKLKFIYIHQLVAMAFLNHFPDGTNKKVVDHINNIKTDNKLNNLQIISHRQNSSKDRKKETSTSKLTGVYFCKKANKFRSRISINSKTKYLGTFNTEKDAYEAYQKELNKLNLFEV